jgi:hypothetical protein
MACYQQNWPRHFLYWPLVSHHMTEQHIRAPTKLAAPLFILATCQPPYDRTAWPVTNKTGRATKVAIATRYKRVDIN